jgi:regulator of nucleoside diphosphate kinase
MRAFESILPPDSEQGRRAVEFRWPWNGPLQPVDGCCLTSRDYTLLEGHLLRMGDSDSGAEPVLAALIRAKLARARVVLSADVDPDVATGGSRIVYSADEGPEQRRTLVHWDSPGEDPLPVASLLGATLLGMRVGQLALVPRHDGGASRVSLVAVPLQPEAARKGRAGRS